MDAQEDLMLKNCWYCNKCSHRHIEKEEADKCCTPGFKPKPQTLWRM